MFRAMTGHSTLEQFIIDKKAFAISSVETYYYKRNISQSDMMTTITTQSIIVYMCTSFRDKSSYIKHNLEAEQQIQLKVQPEYKN